MLAKFKRRISFLLVFAMIIGVFTPISSVSAESDESKSEEVTNENAEDGKLEENEEDLGAEEGEEALTAPELLPPEVIEEEDLDDEKETYPEIEYDVIYAYPGEEILIRIQGRKNTNYEYTEIIRPYNEDGYGKEDWKSVDIL